jgi:hypothetical protein
MPTGSAKLTKAERALLRELAEEAWNAELTEHLEELFEDFGRWADDGMSAFDLSKKIHEFHDGVSRELYSRYTTFDPATTVARAIAIGLIGQEALGESLLQKLAGQIEAFRDLQDG